MKSLLILPLLFSLISIQVSSQYSPSSENKIKTGGTLELGYEDRIIRFTDNTGTSYGTSWLTHKEFAKIDLNANYKGLFIYTDIKTYFTSEKIYVYNPVQVEYWIGIKYKLGRFELSGEHLCSHSISSDFFHEAHDKASVKITLW